MSKFTTTGLFAASILFAAAAPAWAQQRSAQEITVETGREFREADRVTMGSALLTPDEEQRFAAQRKAAKTRADLDRIEAEERALLNQRVAERIAAALREPVGSGSQSGTNAAERPAGNRAPQRAPSDSGGPDSDTGGMGR